MKVTPIILICCLVSLLAVVASTRQANSYHRLEMHFKCVQKVRDNYSKNLGRNFIGLQLHRCAQLVSK